MGIWADKDEAKRTGYVTRDEKSGRERFRVEAGCVGTGFEDLNP